MLELTEKNYHAAVTENFPQLPIETWEPLNEGQANRKMDTSHLLLETQLT